MPYHWLPPSDDGQHLHLWPYRSLSRRGQVAFLGATVALIAVPLLSLLGSPVLWGILPFFVIAVAGLWHALDRSFRDAEIVEDLTFSPERIRLDHHRPGRASLTWEDNPYWVRVRLQPTGGPVENYLTLKGTEREVELGAFLSPEEREALARDLRDALARLH